MNLATLKKHCRATMWNPWMARPIARLRDGKVWTVALDRGYTLLAVRGRLTSNTEGPDLDPETRRKWREARSVSFAAVRNFVLSDHSPADKYGAIPICVNGVTFDAVRLAPLLRLVEADEVLVSASVQMGERVTGKTPHSLKIEAPDWLIIIAGYCAKPVATLGKARRHVDI